MNDTFMKERPVFPLILSMAMPMVISMLVQAMYNIVDSIFVSMISQSALTAVSMAFPVQNLIIAVSAGTCVGVNALLSRSLGEHNQKNADSAAANGVFLAFLTSSPGLCGLRPVRPVRFPPLL